MNQIFYRTLKYGILTLLKIIDVGSRDLGQVFGHGTLMILCDSWDAYEEN